MPRERLALNAGLLTQCLACRPAGSHGSACVTETALSPSRPSRHGSLQTLYLCMQDQHASTEPLLDEQFPHSVGTVCPQCHRAIETAQSEHDHLPSLKPPKKAGRPRKPDALSDAERQRRRRAKLKALAVAEAAEGKPPDPKAVAPVAKLLPPRVSLLHGLMIKLRRRVQSAVHSWVIGLRRNNPNFGQLPGGRRPARH